MISLPIKTAGVAADDPLAIWHLRTSPTTVNLTAVAFGNDRFVAVSESQGITVSSTDGVTWTRHDGPVKNRSFYGLAFGNGLFVAAGSVGKIVTSPDGIEWTLQDSKSSANLDSVGFFNNQFVVVGGSGAILTSPDGVNWTSRSTSSSDFWSGIVYADGKYVAVGTLTTTSRGSSSQSAGLDQLGAGAPVFSQSLYCITHGAGKFVAGGWGGYVLTSLDGIQWNSTNRLGFSHVKDIRFQDGQFVAVGEDGSIRTSADGTEWTRRASGLSEPMLRGVAFGGGTFVAVGDGGRIYQSDPTGTVSSEIVLSNPEPAGNQFRFWFRGDIGRSYRVERSSGFQGWMPISTVVCTASPTPCLVPTDGGPAVFYRLVEL